MERWEWLKCKWLHNLFLQVRKENNIFFSTDTKLSSPNEQRLYVQHNRFQDLKLQCVNLPFHFPPAFPHLSGSEWQIVPRCGKCSPNQNSPLRKHCQCPRHMQGAFCQSAAQVKCNFSVVLVSPRTPQNDISVTQGHCVLIDVNISWEIACLGEKLWKDRQGWLLFRLCKLGKKHLPLLEMEKNLSVIEWNIVVPPLIFYVIIFGERNNKYKDKPCSQMCYLFTQLAAISCNQYKLINLP